MVLATSTASLPYCIVFTLFMGSTGQWHTPGGRGVGESNLPLETEPLFLKWSVQTVQVQYVLLF